MQEMLEMAKCRLLMTGMGGSELARLVQQFAGIGSVL
jgi:hypothetical protein